MAMDFISGPTAAATVPRSPDSDTDTPPHPPPSKRAHHQHQHHGNSNSNENCHVSYKECLKNHAASIGGHALDGCCEFMPGPTVNPMDPTSLTCAACGCHRNFHRRDPDDPTPLHHLIPPSAVARKPRSPPSASQLLLSLSGGHTQSPSAPSDHEAVQNPTAVSGGGGVLMGFYQHHHNNNHNNGVAAAAAGGGQNSNFQSKKRFRTKFTQEQKEKMYEFSEKIGWKLKKGEEKLVEDFCKQVRVDRSVFKVWMHNNKHSSSTSTPNPTPQISSLMKKEKTTSISSNYESHHENTTTTNNNNTSNTNNNNNISSGNNVGLNCGGVLASAFNFANGAAQEAKAQ